MRMENVDGGDVGPDDANYDNDDDDDDADGGGF